LNLCFENSKREKQLFGMEICIMKNTSLTSAAETVHANSLQQWL